MAQYFECRINKKRSPFDYFSAISPTGIRLAHTFTASYASTLIVNRTSQTATGYAFAEKE